MNCNRPIKVEHIGDLPIDNLNSLPDFILAERDIEDEATGNIVRTIVRVKADKLFPNVNVDNLFALETNNVSIDTPKNQVRACRIAHEVSVNRVYFADATHAPQFMILSVDNGTATCQNTGVINIPEGHNLIVGAQYYVGANGEPTTTVSDYKLFIPISGTQLLINM